MTNTTKHFWEEDWISKWNNNEFESNYSNEISHDKIKSFISSIEHQTKERIVKELEGMKVKISRNYDRNCLIADSWNEVIMYEDGHDAGIEDAINMIKK